MFKLKTSSSSPTFKLKIPTQVNDEALASQKYSTVENINAQPKYIPATFQQTKPVYQPGIKQFQKLTKFNEMVSDKPIVVSDEDKTYTVNKTSSVYKYADLLRFTKTLQEPDKDSSKRIFDAINQIGKDLAHNKYQGDDLKVILAINKQLISTPRSDNLSRLHNGLGGTLKNFAGDMAYVLSKVVENMGPDFQQAAEFSGDKKVQETYKKQKEDYYKPIENLMQSGNEDIIKSTLGLKGASKVTADVLTSSLNFGLHLGLSAASGGAINPLFTMGLQSAGQGMYQAKQQGANENQQLMYGISSGIIESVTEKIPLEKLTSLLKAGKKPLATIVTDVLKQMGMEGTEEFISQLGQNISEKLIYNKDKNVFDDVWYSSFVGALSGALMSGGAIAVSQANAKPQIENQVPQIEPQIDSRIENKPVQPEPIQPFVLKTSQNTVQATTESVQPQNVNQELNTPIENTKVLQPVTAQREQYGQNTVGSAEMTEAPTIEQLNKEFGTLRKGEEPRVRTVALPQETRNGKVSRFVQNVSESGAVNEDSVNAIKESIKNEDNTYVPTSNKKDLDNANYDIENLGYDGALKKFKGAIESGKRLTSGDGALGERLIQEAQRNGDTATVTELVTDMALTLTEAGQYIQIARMLKRLTPTGKLLTITKTVNKLNKEMAQKFKDKTKFTKIELPQEYSDKILNAKDETELNQAVEEAQNYISEKVPSYAWDKVNAWRYLSMLGNLRTHARNVMGNMVMLGVRKVKNLIATGLESNIKGERSKTILTKEDKLLKDFAKKDFEDNKGDITGSSRYDIKYAILNNKRIFNNKVLEWLRKFNFKLLEKEDAWFLKSAYVDSMAQYLKANNLNPDKLTSTQEQKARNYASLEAQKATFRDASALVNALNSIGQKHKAAKVGLDIVMPFKKTPVNIVKRGIEYSPIGFIKGITSDVKKLKNGDMKAYQVIDNISAGLTGTGIFAVGFWLASLGIISGREKDQDKKAAFDKNSGEQQYSISLFGKSYSLDWLAPSVMPFMTGVEFFNQFKKDSNDIEGFFDKLTRSGAELINPILDTSMMSGIQSMLSTYQQGGAGFLDYAENMISGYAGQFIPTISGQLARTIDDKSRSTYMSSNSDLGFFEKLGRTTMNKIPGLSMLNEPYVNHRGEEVKSEGGNALGRGLLNFVSPGILKSKNSTPSDKEILRLYEANKDISTLPKDASKTKSITNNKIEYTFSPQEHTKYSKTLGKTAYDLFDKIFTSKIYQDLDDELKTKVVKSIYEYASTTAKNEFLQSRNIPSNNEYDFNIPLELYFVVNQKYNSLTSKENGKTVNGLKERRYKEYLYALPDEYKKYTNALIKLYYKE